MPEGLARFQKVTLRGSPEGNRTVMIVADDAGREYRLFHNQYRMVEEWRVGDKWFPESDPRAQQFIRDLIEKIKLEGPKSYTGAKEAHDDTILRLEQVLRRNGVEP